MTTLIVKQKKTNNMKKTEQKNKEYEEQTNR